MTQELCSARIVEPQTKTILATIYRDRVEFTTEGKGLRSNLELSGVNIPAEKRVAYMGRSVVHIADPLFPKAFVDCYFPSCLKESGLKLIQS